MIGERPRCPECQARVSIKARWCPSCGTELPGKPVPAATAAADAPIEDISPAVDAAASSPSSTWSSLSLRVTAALVLLLVLAVAAGAWIVVVKRDSTIASNGQETSSAVRDAVLASASEGMTKAYTLTAATHVQDNAAAEKFMTQKMIVRFSGQFTAAQWKVLTAGGAKQTAQVSLAVLSLTKDSAQVSAVVVVTTTAKGSSSRSVLPLRMKVTLLNVGGTWLIDDMSPF